MKIFYDDGTIKIRSMVPVDAKIIAICGKICCGKTYYDFYCIKE